MDRVELEEVPPRIHSGKESTCKSRHMEILRAVPGTGEDDEGIMNEMSRSELVEALRRLAVETGSLACLGCVHERNCGVHGCAILLDAVSALRNSDEAQAVSNHKRYRCIKRFALDRYDDNGEEVWGEPLIIDDGMIFDEVNLISTGLIVASHPTVHLENKYGLWIEIHPDTLVSHFEEVDS